MRRLELVIVLALQHIQQFTVYMVRSTWDDCSLQEQSIPIQYNKKSRNNISKKPNLNPNPNLLDFIKLN